MDLSRFDNIDIDLPDEEPIKNSRLSDVELDPIVNKASEYTGIDRGLIKAIIYRESGGDPNAIGHTPDGKIAFKGGKGLMQLVDSTAREVGVQNSFDPEQNVIGGARYLQKLLEIYKGDEKAALRHYRGMDESQDPTWYSDIEKKRLEYNQKLQDDLSKFDNIDIPLPDEEEVKTLEPAIAPVGAPERQPVVNTPTSVNIESPETNSTPEKKQSLWDSLKPIRDLTASAVDHVSGAINTGANIVAGAARLPGDLIAETASQLGARYGLGERSKTAEGQDYLSSGKASSGNLQDNPLIQEASNYFNNTSTGKFISEHSQEAVDIAFTVMIAKDMGSMALAASKLYAAGRPISQILGGLPKDVVGAVQTEMENVKRIPANIAERVKTLGPEARGMFYTTGWRSLNDKEKTNLKDWMVWKSKAGGERGEEPVLSDKLKNIFTAEGSNAPGLYATKGSFDIEKAKQGLKGEKLVSEEKLKFGLGKIFKGKQEPLVVVPEKPIVAEQKEPGKTLELEVSKPESKVVEPPKQEVITPEIAKQFPDIVEGTPKDIARGTELEKLVPMIRFQGVSPGLKGENVDIKPTFTYKIDDGNQEHSTNIEIPLDANAETVAKTVKNKIAQFDAGKEVKSETPATPKKTALVFVPKGREVELVDPKKYFIGKKENEERYFSEVKGTKVDIPELSGGDYFAHKSKEKGWVISEGKTGQSITGGYNTRADAIGGLIETVKAIGSDKFIDTIKKAIEGGKASAGLSPRYKIKEDLPKQEEPVTPKETPSITEDDQIAKHAKWMVKQNPNISFDAAKKNVRHVLYVVKNKEYSTIVHPANKTSRKLYENITGEALPKSVKATQEYFKTKVTPEAPKPEIAAEVKAPVKIGDLFNYEGRKYRLYAVKENTIEAQDMAGPYPLTREWSVTPDQFQKGTGIKLHESALPENQVVTTRKEVPNVPEKVQAETQTEIKPEVKKEPVAESALTKTEELSDRIYKALKEGKSIDNPSLTKVADSVYAGTKLEGKYTSKDAYDALEAGVNKIIIEKGKDWLEKDPAESLKEIRELTKRLPRQTDRTKEQEDFQQFSTPPTEAFVAAKAADINPDDVVLEPSAGIGGLAAWPKSKGAMVHTNELSTRRLEILKKLGFETTNVDAELIHDLLPENIKPNKIIMNPPFSATAGRTKTNKTEYGAKHVESALNRLEEGGRLVAIVGEGMGLDKPKFLNWWKDISSKYTVRANIGVPGEEYGKYGTTFGNQLLVIDKAGPTKGVTYSEQLNGIIKGQAKSLEDVLDRIKEIPNANRKSGDVGKTSRSTGVGSGGAGEPVVVGTPGGSTARRPAKTGGQNKPDIGTRNVPESKPESGTKPTAQPPVKDTGVVSKASGGTLPDSGGNGENGSTGGVSREKNVEKKETEASGNFVQYRPAKLKGAKPHEGLVESASMASVEPPDITYVPKLAKGTVEKGDVSDAQLETISYAGQRHEQTLPDGRRAGYFIGDGTGVGKGREISGIILDNWNRGRKKALWVSISSDLKKDASRDLGDVGAGEIPIELINEYSGKGGIDQKEGIVFATYSTFSRPERLKQIKDWLGKDGIVIFDESHKAKNYLSSGQGTEGTATGAAVVDIQTYPEGKDLRVVYVSATGATDVRNMAYMVRLGLWGEGTAFPGGFTDFLNKIEGGGVGAMEMVARDLKALGMYNSRIISFKGVDYLETKHVLTGKQTEMYDAVVKMWQVVFQNIDKAIGITNAPARVRGRKMANFWSQNQRFFKQLITAIKVPTVIKRTEEELAKGHSVVISLKGTGESRTKDLVSKIVAEGGDLDDFDITPREIIGKMIEDSFPTELYQDATDEQGNSIKVQVKDSQGNHVHSKEAIAMKEKLLDGLGKFDIPENPLDQIVNYFGSDKVAELTGRSKRLVVNKKTGKKEYVNRTSKGISQKEVNNSEREAFQNGKKKIAIISDAASTGISLHADRRAKNQQKRVQMSLEMGWSADKEIQTLGRTHRSGQIMPPSYDLLSTNLGGEIRFSSTLAKRLDTLGALTRGQRNVSGAGDLSKYNFETPQGEAALNLLYSEMMGGNEIEGIKKPIETLERMGIASIDAGGRLKIKDGDMDDVPRFLNRILGLEVDEQNTVFKAFSDRFDEIVSREKDEGTFDDGVSDLAGESVRIRPNATIVNTHEATGAITRHYVVEVDKKTEPLKYEKAEKIIGAFSKEAVIASKEAWDIEPGFVKNGKSGRVYLMRPFTRYTDTKTGYVGNKARLTGPKNKDITLLSYELTGYDSIDKADAEALWNKELDKIPKIITEEHHVIAGALIPIYDKLSDAKKMKIVRVEADNGERLVGVDIDEKDIVPVLAQLGIKKSFKSAEEIFTGVYENGWDVELVTGLQLHRTTVHSDDAIELKGIDYGQYDELRNMGLLNEKIDWKQRFFIPTDPDKGIPVLEKLLKRYPAMSADSEKTQGLEDKETKYLNNKQYHSEIPEVKNISVKNLKKMHEDEVSVVSKEVAENMNFEEPIEVSVFKDGELRISDGHHRVAAARMVHKERLPVKLKAINALGEHINKLIMDQPEETQAFDAKKWDVNLPLEKTTDETINKTQVLDYIESAFGVAVRGRATERWKNAGMYYTNAEMIRQKKWGELEVTAHEIAHHIDKLMKKKMGDVWKFKGTTPDQKRKISRELKDLDYDIKQKRISEGFAEYVRHDLSVNDADKVAPEFNKRFYDEVLVNDKDLREKYIKLKNMYQTWYNQGSHNRVRQQIDMRREHTRLSSEKMMRTTKDKLIVNWIDSLYPIQKVEKETGLKVGENIRPTQSPFMMATYAKSKAASVVRTVVMEKNIDMYGNITGPGLLEILEPIRTSLLEAIKGNSVGMNDFIEYAVCKNAMENYIKKGKESGFDVADVEKVIADAPKDMVETWDKVIKGITDWGHNLIKGWYVPSGKLSEAEALGIIAGNKIWIPFQRAFKEEMQIFKKGGIATGSVNSAKGVHARKGSGKPVINPIESLVQQATGIIQGASKANIARLLADVSTREGMGGFIKKVPPPMEATRFNLEQVRKALEKELEGTDVDVDDLELDRMVTVFTNAGVYKGKDNVVSIWINGERQWFEIHPEMYKALTSLDIDKQGVLVSILAPFARITRLGATGLRASFAMIKNPFRDALTYSVLSRSKNAHPLEILKGIYEMMNSKEGGLYWKFKATGGALSGMLGFDRQQTMKVYDEVLSNNLKNGKKDLYVLKHPIEATRDLLSFMELAPRSVELGKMYIQNKKEHPEWTEDDLFIKSFIDAQDVTTNFTRNGNFSKQLNATNAFFNVAIQGPEKAYRSFKENPLRYILRGLSYLTVPTLILYLINKDKQWFKNLPKEYKYSNYFIEVGDQIIRLPMPFDVGILFGSIPMAIADHDKEGVQAITKLVGNSLPNFIPSALQPLVDIWRNKDYLGRPIESRSMQELPVTERKEKYTTGIASLLAHVITATGSDASPVQVDYLINNYTGGFTNQIPMRPIKGLEDFPVIADILVRTPENPRRQLDKFFKDFSVLKQKKVSKTITAQESAKLGRLKDFYSDWKETYLPSLRQSKDKDNKKSESYTYSNIVNRLKNIGYE